VAEQATETTRFGGHHWQMGKWSLIYQMAVYVYGILIQKDVVLGWY